VTPRGYAIRPEIPAIPTHGNARRVYAELHRGAMPPGNKWPQDWLDEYQNWMAGGFQSGLPNEQESDK
jgi:hypothetical protein